ncbi:MAG TPA: NAD(P)H-dependent oxidoreductase [Acetobacteraceae bacterium]|nr:NAD(P)H-dependent oxidoreductase [Acetobacteraceae bacterium]
MPDKRILLVYAHRNRDASRINRALLEAAAVLPAVTIHDLTKVYPDGKIDVVREQSLLLEHDIIVLQFPFYWYSSPAILKEWQDAVLEWGFAYGSGGDKLHGKQLMIATSAGGPAEMYQSGGLNQFTMSELLRPFQAMANLTGMRWLPVFSLHGTRVMDDALLSWEADRYVTRLASL